MQRSAGDLVTLYLGERTGEHVLAGRTKRGEGERIHAVIWLCDLRDSTRLSEALPVERFFRSLNEFFEPSTPIWAGAGPNPVIPIRRHGHRASVGPSSNLRPI